MVHHTSRFEVSAQDQESVPCLRTNVFYVSALSGLDVVVHVIWEILVLKCLRFTLYLVGIRTACTGLLRRHRFRLFGRKRGYSNSNGHTFDTKLRGNLQVSSSSCMSVRVKWVFPQCGQILFLKSHWDSTGSSIFFVSQTPRTRITNLSTKTRIAEKPAA